MNIFQEVENVYGKELAHQAIAVIDDYVDNVFPEYAKRDHDFMSRALRMVFAKKLLDCSKETHVPIEYWPEILVLICENSFLNGVESTIYHATSPKVLGYGIISHTEFGFECVKNTNYQPVGDYY